MVEKSPGAASLDPVETSLDPAEVSYCPLSRLVAEEDDVLLIITPRRTLTRYELHQSIETLRLWLQAHVPADNWVTLQFSNNSLTYLSTLVALYRNQSPAALVNHRTPPVKVHTLMENLLHSRTYMGHAADNDDSNPSIHTNPSVASQSPSSIYYLSEQTLANMLSQSELQKSEKNGRNTNAPNTNAPVRPIAINSQIPMQVVFTSGSTRSEPNASANAFANASAKAVVYSLDDLFKSAVRSNEILGVTAQKRWYLCLPLYHISGLSIWVRTLMAGARLYLDETKHFSPQTVLQAIETHRITHLSLVPTQLLALLECNNALAILKQCDVILLGGSSIPPHLWKLTQILPIYVTYGMTETLAHVALHYPPAAQSLPTHTATNHSPPTHIPTTDSPTNHPLPPDSTANHSLPPDSPANHSSTADSITDSPTNHPLPPDSLANHSSPTDSPANHSSTADSITDSPTNHPLPTDSLANHSSPPNSAINHSLPPDSPANRHAASRSQATPPKTYTILPHQHLKISNHQVCIAQENLGRGYLYADKSIAFPLDNEKYFHSDDLGFIDPNGLLHITGRASNRLTSGGETFQIEEIEEILNEIFHTYTPPLATQPKITPAHHSTLAILTTLKMITLYVLGLSHPKWGEVPIAVLGFTQIANIDDTDNIANVDNTDNIANVDNTDNIANTSSSNTSPTSPSALKTPISEPRSSYPLLTTAQVAALTAFLTDKHTLQKSLHATLESYKHPTAYYLLNPIASGQSDLPALNPTEKLARMTLKEWILAQKCFKLC